MLRIFVSSVPKREGKSVKCYKIVATIFIETNSAKVPGFRNWMVYKDIGEFLSTK